MTALQRSLLTGLLSGAALIPAMAAAQEAPPEARSPADLGAPRIPDDEEADAEEIVVVGRRDPNAVIGDIPPENQLRPADIRAYGATSVAELLEAIAPQTASSRGRGGGRPVVLLNGRRTSGFNEIRDLPPEAILRVDILPEEVALKYGYRADQRVVNFVLRPRFRATTGQAEAGVPTEGGSSEGKADLTRLMIGEQGRTALNLHAERQTALLESERDIDFTAEESGEIDPRNFRSLIGSRRLIRASGTVNRDLFEDVSSTFNAQLEYSDGRSLLNPSLIAYGDPLARDTTTLSGEAGFAFNGNKDRWRWSLTGGYALARGETETDRESQLAGRGTDYGRTLTGNGQVDLVASGPFATLPAGAATATLRTGADSQSLDSRSTRLGVESETDLSRRVVDASVNVDVPVARRGGFLSALGNLTLNGNLEVEQLSDLGTLKSWGAGAYWSPIPQVNLITSFTQEEGAPSLGQLGNPLLVTPNARVFDFVTGRTANVELISGGNPDLTADRRRILKIGGTARPLEGADLELRVDYTRSRLSNPISSLPGITASIEAAFPDRFERDAAGNLVRADLRPINGQSTARDELRWGFNFSKPLRSARPSQAQIEQFRRRAADAAGAVRTVSRVDGEDRDDRPRGGDSTRSGGRFGGFGGFGGGGGGGGRQGGRLQLSVFHTILLKDESRIASGIAPLDFLNGQAGEGGLGRPQHRLEANGGYFNNGLGARLRVNWQSGSSIRGGQSGDLRFSPLARLNASLFANLGQRFDLVSRYPWVRGAQLRLSVDNILDAKQKVRDAAGIGRGTYQPDLLDPQGRTLRLSIRKLFLPPSSFFRRGDRSGERSPPTRP